MAIRWFFTYYHRGTYKYKYVEAETAEQAIRKSRLSKSIVDLYPIDENGNRID